MPVSHGMTAGEVARFFQQELEIGCDLSVVRMRGWHRALLWEDTGLDWVQTSPNIPHSLSAHVYIATVLVGGITENVNEGLGTTLPFETIAADFLDPNRFTAAMNAAGLPGVRFFPISYVPFYGRHEGQPMRGARLVLTDRRAFRPLRTALTALTVLERLHPGAVQYKEGRPFAIHWGNEWILERIRAGRSAAEIEAEWSDDLEPIT